MAVSFLRKIQKILEKPEPPAHIRERNIQVIIPWYERFWREIRPPQRLGSKSEPMSPRQRRMIWVTALVLAVLGSVAYGLNYMMEAPARAAAAYERGMAKIGAGEYAAAAQQFTDSIQIKETAAAYLDRGNARNNLGQTEAALADWNRAIQIDPNLAAAYAARGTHYRVSGDMPRALQDLERSLQVGVSVDAYYQRGQVYHALGQFDKAISDYSEAIALRREAPYVYLARAASRKALGDEAGFHEDQDIARALQHGTDAR